MVSTDKLIPLMGLRLKYLTKISLVKIDFWTFPLHYRLTFVLLLAFSLAISCSQFFGDPIMCVKGGDIPEKVVNNFCWIEGTFTLPVSLTKAVDAEIAFPGVEQFSGTEEEDQPLHHMYYQWVSSVLFLQACCFAVTRVLWKAWEGNRVKSIALDLNKCILPESQCLLNQKTLVEYLSMSRGLNNNYAIRYLVCEFINFLNVLIQLKVTDIFLGGEFSEYGSRVLSFFNSNHEGPDPMVTVFPKMTKCSFHRFGSSGDVQKYDNLCLLPINVINEKIYLILWFWLIILAIISGLTLVFRVICFLFSRVRSFIFIRVNHLVPKESCESIVSHCSFGDMFLLSLLQLNLDPLHFRDVLISFSQRLEH